MKTDEELSRTFSIREIENEIALVEIFESEPEEADNGRQADLLAAAIDKFVSKDRNKSYNFLADLTKAGTATAISSHARQVYTNLPKISNFNRVAIVGQSLMLEVSINLIMQATGRSSSFKWFTSREAAINWLLNKGSN